MKNSIRALAGILFLSGLSAMANNTGTFGGHLGWGFPKSDGGNSGGLDVGFNADWTVSTMVNVGLFATYQMVQNDTIPSDQHAFEFPYGLTANVNVLGGPGLYVGLNLGATTMGVSNGTDIVSETHFSTGGQVGFDYPVDDAVAAGLEFRYIQIFASDSTYLMNLNATIRFYF